MKKVIATSLSFAMLLGLTSCGNTNINIPNRVEKPTKETSVSEKSIEEKKLLTLLKMSAIRFQNRKIGMKTSIPKILK